MDHLKKAKALRADEHVHYNCAQSVLVAFAGDAGISEETAFRMGANFGSGMRRGATCGVITGALMVLGLLGRDAAAPQLMQRFQKDHESLDCAALLSRSKEKGIPRKEHCDGLVFEMVQALEEILAAPVEG